MTGHADVEMIEPSTSGIGAVSFVPGVTSVVVEEGMCHFVKHDAEDPFRAVSQWCMVANQPQDHSIFRRVSWLEEAELILSQNTPRHVNFR